MCRDEVGTSGAEREWIVAECKLVIEHQKGVYGEGPPAMELEGHLSSIGASGSDESLGMLSVSDLLKVITSDEKARADLLEAFIYPQR